MKLINSSSLKGLALIALALPFCLHMISVFDALERKEPSNIWSAPDITNINRVSVQLNDFDKSPLFHSNREAYTPPITEVVPPKPAPPPVIVVPYTFSGIVSIGDEVWGYLIGTENTSPIKVFNGTDLGSGWFVKAINNNQIILSHLDKDYPLQKGDGVSNSAQTSTSNNNRRRSRN